jgi:hypothetical protein
MPNLSSSLGTNNDAIPAVNATQIGKFAGLHMVFPTLSALNLAVVTERGNITGSTSIWAAGQSMAVAAEPTAVERSWFVGGSAAASHARTVLLPSGVSVVLAADTNTVLATTGVPAGGTGADGDIAIDVAANLYYLKAAGAWGASLAMSASDAPITITANTTLTHNGHANKVVNVNSGTAVTVTLQTDAAGGFAVTDSLEFINQGAGLLTIVAGGATLNSPAGTRVTARQNESISVDHGIAANTWVVRTPQVGSPIKTVATSRALTAADDGATLECTATVTLTVPAGLPANFGCAVIPSGTTSIASDGTALLNGALTTLTRAAASNPMFGIVLRASVANSHVVSGS